MLYTYRCVLFRIKSKVRKHDLVLCTTNFSRTGTQDISWHPETWSRDHWSLIAEAMLQSPPSLLSIRVVQQVQVITPLCWMIDDSDEIEYTLLFFCYFLEEQWRTEPFVYDKKKRKKTTGEGGINNTTPKKRRNPIGFNRAVTWGFFLLTSPQKTNGVSSRH